MPTYDDGYGKGYFTCPRCKESFDYTEFNEFEHKAKADPSDRTILGQTKCPICSLEFSYELTSDCFPVIADITDSTQSFPPVSVHSYEDEEAPHLTGDDMAVFNQQMEKPHEGEIETPNDAMGMFQKALKKIDKDAELPDKYRMMSESLDLLIDEPPSQVRAGLLLMKQEFGLTARDVEAFRKEINQKKKQKNNTNQPELQISEDLSQPVETLSEEEIAEAIEYLKDPNLFENISRDIAVAGEVVGEEKNKMVLYFAAVSRRFSHPISLVIFGQSGSGKSHLANAIEKFVPEEEKIVASSVTKNFFNYADNLKNKFILIQEFEGTKDVLETIRLLQSERVLAHSITEIDPVTKRRIAKQIRQDCPCSIVFTTTKERIFDENDTRVFRLSVDGSQKQIEAVMKFKKMKAKGISTNNDSERERIFKLHHNIQRVLEPCVVRIPYCDYVGFPTKTARYQRDFDRFIDLIRVVAFLRQMQKRKMIHNGESYIEADLDDYRIAYDMSIDIIKSTINKISDRAKRALKVCSKIHEELTENKKKPVFTVTDILDKATELGYDFGDRYRFYEQLNTLEEYEFVEMHQRKKGATKYYNICFKYEKDEEGEIINIDSPDIKAILSPEELKRKIENHETSVRDDERRDQEFDSVETERKELHYEGNTGLAETKGYQEKQLAELACNIGNMCHFGCTYCYVPTVVTKNSSVQDVLKQGYEWGEVSNYRTKKNLIECVEKDLQKIKPGDKRTVFFCTTCDPCATEEHTNMTISAIRLIMRKSDLQVRVLSKSDRIFEIAKALDDFRYRIIYGLSTGTARAEIAFCIEENASPLQDRLATLNLLQNMRCRTFGMLCPILPSEMPDLDLLIESIHPNECEMIWAEPLNVRGKSLEKTRRRLEECGFKEEAKVLEEVMGNKENWREYTKALFLEVRDEFNKKGILEKLRYLQYVIREPDDFVEFFSSQKEAICLGKKKLK